jgi:hypothetical protein
VILAGEEQDLRPFMDLECMRRTRPRRIACSDLGEQELAAIVVDLVQKTGQQVT